LTHQIDRLGPLQDPVRRAIYFFVAEQAESVSREQAARGVGVTRALAAFHLDRLVAGGLLTATYKRLSGRTGPGAGRPSKLYRRSERPIEVTLPTRRYDLAAHLLARAIAAVDSEAGRDALRRAATAMGRELGLEARAQAGAAGSRATPAETAQAALREVGFEPRLEADGTVVLGNCPFSSLRDESRELVCAMNLALCQGLVAGLQLAGIEARLEPDPGRCCVVFRRGG
jgi:predicted ArsR family transcriptional regulator